MGIDHSKLFVGHHVWRASCLTFVFRASCLMASCLKASFWGLSCWWLHVWSLEKVSSCLKGFMFGGLRFRSASCLKGFISDGFMFEGIISRVVALMASCLESWKRFHHVWRSSFWRASCLMVWMSSCSVGTVFEGESPLCSCLKWPLDIGGRIVNAGSGRTEKAIHAPQFDLIGSSRSNSKWLSEFCLDQFGWIGIHVDSGSCLNFHELKLIVSFHDWIDVLICARDELEWAGFQIESRDFRYRSDRPRKLELNTHKWFRLLSRGLYSWLGRILTVDDVTAL